MTIINLASIVFEARKKTGMSQSEFATFMERNTQTISKYERGISRPSMRFIEKCKRILVTKPDELLACMMAFRARSFGVINGL